MKNIILITLPITVKIKPKLVYMVCLLIPGATLMAQGVLSGSTLSCSGTSFYYH